MVGFCSASMHICRLSSSVSFLLDVDDFALVGVTSLTVPADIGVCIGGTAGKMGGG